MKPQDEKLDEQPAEGDRDVVDRELARQDEKSKSQPKKTEPVPANKKRDLL